MKEGLAALTKLVKVVMSYRPDRGKPAGSPKSRVASSPAVNTKKKHNKPARK